MLHRPCNNMNAFSLSIDSDKYVCVWRSRTIAFGFMQDNKQHLVYSLHGHVNTLFMVSLG